MTWNYIVIILHDKFYKQALLFKTLFEVPESVKI